MAKKTDRSAVNSRIFRIIDANINRLREALRVVEEVVRFVLDDKKNNLKLKSIRHALETILKKMKPEMALIELSRDSGRDVGKDLNIPSELRKNDCGDILMANIHRAEESLRVLEEFLKLYDKNTSICFKKLRFQLYILERDILRKISRV